MLHFFHGIQIKLLFCFLLKNNFIEYIKKSSQKQKTHFILALTFKRLIPLLCPIGEIALLDLIKKKPLVLL